MPFEIQKGRITKEATKRAEEYLQLVGLEKYKHNLATKMSGGQQQRVLIAMAMLNNPSLLIMDEPTTALDVTVEAAVLDLISELQKNTIQRLCISVTISALWPASRIKWR